MDAMNKAERLAVAGAVAPSLRQARPRKIALVDKDGRVTGYTTSTEVAKSLLAAKKIELEVEEGVRPKEIFCEKCGKIVKTNRSGKLNRYCRKCLFICACGGRKTGSAVMCPACRSCRYAGYVCACGEKKVRKASRGCSTCRAKLNEGRRCCADCGSVVSVSTACKATRRGTIPRCLSCYKTALRNKHVILCACGAALNPKAMDPSRVSQRNGKTPVCRQCYLSSTDPSHRRKKETA